MVKMTNRKIKLRIDWLLKKGETVNQVANTVEQFVKIFKETGKYPILNKKKTKNVTNSRSEKDNKISIQRIIFWDNNA